MKVCSLCEFIYEDDQSLCDMDGAELVYDPAPRALNPVASPQPATPARSSRWKRLGATVVAGIVLATVLILVFQIFALRNPEQLSSRSEAPAYSAPRAGSDSQDPDNLDLALPVPLTPLVDAAPLPTATPGDGAPEPGASPHSPAPQSTHSAERGAKATAELSPSPNADKNGGNETASVKAGPEPSRPRAVRVSESTRKPAQTRPKQSEDNHKESAVTSILKKTGRILKKPFKF